MSKDKGCARCGMGSDGDRDGDCVVCAHLSDEQATLLKGSSLLSSSLCGCFCDPGEAMTLEGCHQSGLCHMRGWRTPGGEVRVAFGEARDLGE